MPSQTETQERNRKIAEYAQANPCVTLQQIGDYHGLTRERVRQILAKRGVQKPRRRRSVALCVECGEEVVGSKARTPRHQRCGQLTVVCSLCGDSFQRRRSDVIRQANDSRYRLGLVICPPCHPQWNSAIGRVLGRRKTVPGKRAKQPFTDKEELRRLILQELGR